MACTDGKAHRYRPVPTTHSSGHKSVAMKRCTGCGKTVETYLWLKILAAILIIGGIAATIINHLNQ